MTKVMHSALGDHDMGDGVDLFGLDEWGQPVGMNPLWGAMAGVGVATAATIAVRQLTKPASAGAAESTLHKFSELVGGAVGALAGGAMIFFPRTRAAGWTALATALVGNGLRQLEISLLSQTPAGASTTQQPSAQQPAPGTSGWGEVAVENTRLVSMNGPLGLVTPEVTAVVQAPGMNGAFGSDASRAELVGPPNLADGAFAQHPGAAQVRLAGGPPLSQLGAHYGVTLFGN